MIEARDVIRRAEFHHHPQAASCLLEIVLCGWHYMRMVEGPVYGKLGWVGQEGGKFILPWMIDSNSVEIIWAFFPRTAEP